MTLSRLGRYDIAGTLGRGAMGVVYRARDPLIEREVAIKTVACAGLPAKEAEEFEQRFFREAKSAGRLNHPNIVTVYDVGRDGELAWIAMEFLSGRSLRDLIDAGTPLPLERVVDIVAAVADALAFAHAQGIIHRDVKPANIMVPDSGSVKLADFGIAQLPGGGMTMAGAVLGSPKYMSPEQVSGQKADGRSDIFSLGSVLYELLTGKPPFDGDNLHATMYQVVHKEAPPPSGCRSGLPATLDTIVARAMAKDPAARYQDAAEMAGDLRRALNTAAATQPAERSDVGISGVPAPPARRLKYAMIAGALLLLGSSTFVILKDSRPDSPPTPPPVAAERPAPAAESDKTPRPAERSPEKVAPTPAPTPAKNAPPAQERKAEREPAKAIARPKPPPDWQAGLQADLQACAERSLFSRMLCVEKARWKHCPGHWGEIADCPSSSGEKGPPP